MAPAASKRKAGRLSAMAAACVLLAAPGITGGAAEEPAPAAQPSGTAAPAAQTSGTRAPETPGLNMDALYDIGRQLFEDFAPEKIKEQYEFMSIEDWHAFVRQFQETLASGSMEDIAALQPKAALTLQAMRMKPEASAYADWLAERMELIEGAKEALAQNGTTRAIRPDPKPGAHGPATIKPPPQNLRPPAIVFPSATTAPSAAPGDARHGTPSFSLQLIKPIPAPFYEIPPASDSVPYYDLWLKRVSKRAVPKNAASLSPLLKIIFLSENLPAELIWLAEIESSFNPRALSPAGACGLYQLMPATAKAFGLSLAPVDERTHAGKNARAAARLLHILYKRFGSWPLALAAYNAGEGRVAVALKKTPGAKTYADIAQKLPAETRLYVPQVIATMVVRENVPLEKFVPRETSAIPAVTFTPGKPRA